MSSEKSFSQCLKELGIAKARLARELGVSPEQVSRWGEAPPRYAQAYLEQLRKNIENERLLDEFVRGGGLHVTDVSMSLSAMAPAAPLCAQDVAEGAPALVLFPRQGRRRSESGLLLRDNGTGYAGDYPIDPSTDCDRVVLYLRPENHFEQNEVIKADFIYAEGPMDAEGKRYKVHFRHWEKVGTTTADWKEFAGGGVQPWRWLNLG